MVRGGNLDPPCHLTSKAWRTYAMRNAQNEAEP